MKLTQLLVAIIMVVWYLPVFRFKGNRYFLFFLINSLVDPLYYVIRHLFHVHEFNYLPVNLLVIAVTFPLNDGKSKLISIVSLAILTINLGKNPFLELVMCEIVLSFILYNLIKHITRNIKRSSSVNIFELVLLLYFLEVVFYYYLYYQNLTLFVQLINYTLASFIIYAILIIYFGNEGKVDLKQHFQKGNPDSEAGITFVNYSGSIISPNINLLTKTELRVLSSLSEGLEYKDICDRMFISKRTVYFHVQNIKNKLELNSTNQLKKFAIESRGRLQMNRESFEDVRTKI